MFERLAILMFFVLIPVCVVVCVLSILAVVFHTRLGRFVRWRWPKMGRNLHLIVPITAFCVVVFLLLAGAYMAGTHQQYWLNEPMCTAAGNGDPAEVERLLERGASPDAEGIDFVDRAIVAAAEGGYQDVVALLIEHGADVDAKDNFGHTAMYWARTKGYQDIAELLAEAGARAD